jgi:hypothetical protein
MQFEIRDAVAVLGRTPATLAALLDGLPNGWTRGNEGTDSWSPFDVVGHLIHGEQTDWMPRLRMILEHGPARPFDPFDRFAQFEASKGKSLRQLLDEFATLRARNLRELEVLHLMPDDLRKQGSHPALGTVTAGQLLATWAVHDLDHIVQISRAMAKQYRDQVGPWGAYLSVLHDRESAKANG